MTERGKIRNRQHAGQLRDFSGLRFGSITPTDIDAFMEFGDRAYVFIEAKHGGAPLPFGQRLALERLTDAVGINRRSLLVIAAHDTAGDIELGACVVTQYRSRGLWRIPKAGTTTRELVAQFVEHVRKESN